MSQYIEHYGGNRFVGKKGWAENQEFLWRCGRLHES